jgi:hypothetical protein
LALFLVRARLSGQEIPTTLPSSLVTSVTSIVSESPRSQQQEPQGLYLSFSFVSCSFLLLADDVFFFFSFIHIFICCLSSSHGKYFSNHHSHFFCIEFSAISSITSDFTKRLD